MSETQQAISALYAAIGGLMAVRALTLNHTQTDAEEAK